MSKRYRKNFKKRILQQTSCYRRQVVTMDELMDEIKKN